MQYFRLKRILEKRYTAYVSDRDRAAPAVQSTIADRIPPGKKKLAEGGPPHFNDDDEDASATHQHRYARRSGVNAALWLQKWQRLETGYSYPYAIGSSSSHSGSRFRCSFQPANAAPCYNCSLPMSRFCQAHILKDPLQRLYKSCEHTEFKKCERAILRPRDPSFCDTHMLLSEFVRNPRVSRLPQAALAHAQARGEFPNLEEDLNFGASAPLDLDDLQALVGEVSQTPVMALADFDGLSNIMGQLQEDESKAVAELQQSLANVGGNSHPGSRTGTPTLASAVAATAAVAAVAGAGAGAPAAPTATAVDTAAAVNTVAAPLADPAVDAASAAAAPVAADPVLSVDCADRADPVPAADPADPADLGPANSAASLSQISPAAEAATEVPAAAPSQ